MSTVTLTPVVTDDGWGGALTYAWTQVSGPDAAAIATPAALSTGITLSGVGGAYVFRITVARADDALVGTGLWHVYVFAAFDQVPPDDATGAVVLTVNGVETPCLINSVQIGKGLGPGDTCSFALYGATIALFNDVVLERETVRLFGGICLSIGKTVDNNHIFTHPNLVGYAWHFGRVRVTHTYDAQSISDIAADLLARAPGGLTGDCIAADLPIATLELVDVTIADAFDTLARIEPGLHWKVDDYKRLHVALLETDGASVEVSPAHPPLMEGLSVTTDGGLVVNRVLVHYDQVVTQPVLVDAELRVDSLTGYSPAGGDTVINGNTIHYSGTRSAPLDPVYGVVRAGLSPTDVEDSGGELSDSYQYFYAATLVTALGETPLVSAASPRTPTPPHNAMKIRLESLTGDPADVARLTAINVYRSSDEPPAGGEDASAWTFVGSLSPHGGSLMDTESFATRVDSPVFHPPTVNTADALAYYLTGCSGSQAVHTTAQVMVEDTAAQAVLAAALGGDDDGVIESSLNGGAISAAQALTLAGAFLARSVDPRTSLSCRVRNDAAVPGQQCALLFPPPLDVLADLKIQQATISGFEPGIPTARAITAATEIVRLEDLLTQGAGASGAAVSQGSASGQAGGVTGATGATGATGPAGATGATGATGPAGPSVWGGITGTLGSQTDLATALADKASISGSYANPAWITSLAGSKIAGAVALSSTADAWTTARLLAGNSVNGAANVAFANKFLVQGTADAGLTGAQFLGALATGILKNTVTTGVLSIAVAGDFPTLNQSTTGSAATLTTPRAINGVTFDGSAAITVPAAAGTLTGATLAANVLASSLTSVGTLTGGATGAGFTIALSTSTVTGALADARLSANVALLNGTNVFTGQVSLSSANPIPLVTWTNTANFAQFRFMENATQVAVVGAMGSAFATTSRQNDLELQTTNGGDIVFWTGTGGSTQKMKLSLLGGLYVGTADTDAGALNIRAAGNVTADGTLVGANLTVSAANPIPLLTWTNTANFSQLRFMENSTLVGLIGGMGSAFTTAGRRNDVELQTVNGGDITFWTGSGSSTQKMKLSLAGGLFVGTADTDAGANNIQAAGTITATGGFVGAAPAGSLSGATLAAGVTASSLTSLGTQAADLKFVDATYDIGKSGATRPRDLFLSRNLRAEGLVVAIGSGDNSFGSSVTGINSVSVYNVNATGTGNSARFEARADESSGIVFGMTSSTYNTAVVTPADPPNIASQGWIGAGRNGGLTLYSQNGPTNFYQGNGTTLRGQMTTGGIFIWNGLIKFAGTNSTGAGSALLGANCPAVTATAPYKWLQAQSADGSTVYIPCWK
jgi:K319L-like, PKD domain